MTDALIVSRGQDTNGQNARYGEAARKYGSHERVLSILAAGKIDPGGVVARLQKAADHHPEAGLSIRSAHRDEQYFGFPNDLRWGHAATRQQNAELRQLAKAADVLHLNNNIAAVQYLGLGRPYDKPMLLHHHGSYLRSDPQRSLGIAAMRKMVQGVSTIDLQRSAPDVLHWLPTAYDIEALRAIPRVHGDPDRVRVGHFPTNRELKHTDLFIQAVRELQSEGLPIDLVPGEFLHEKADWLPRWTWETAMASKASCDVVYDQMAYGYGCNSVESWGMGIPVVAGADDWTLRRMRDLWGGLPFVPAKPQSLKGVLRKMVQSKQMREDAAGQGLAHALKYHDELPALAILAGLYADAITLRHAPRIQGKGVLFQSRRHKVMTVDGIAVDFTKGQIEVTDVAVVEKLRRTVKQRPTFGIEEVQEDVA